MRVSRREFVAMGLAGAAGLCVCGCAPDSAAAEPPSQLPDEDGYQLWLRYAPPGDAAQWRDQILDYFGRFSKQPVPRFN